MWVHKLLHAGASNMSFEFTSTIGRGTLLVANGRGPVEISHHQLRAPASWLATGKH